MSESDFALIDRVLAGEVEAFDLLVQRHQREVYRLTYRMARNQEDAKDLAQEAFLQAFRSLAGFGRKSSFYTWLYRIAMNLCLNHLKARPRAPSGWEPGEIEAGLPDPGEDALGTLLADERRQALVEAIEALPPQQKATLTLRVHQGLSHKEIAEILECSEGTAKANYFHAVRALQAKLRRYRAGS